MSVGYIFTVYYSFKLFRRQILYAGVNSFLVIDLFNELRDALYHIDKALIFPTVHFFFWSVLKNDPA